jgi:hypothetical protein
MADPITISLTAIPGLLASIAKLSVGVQKFVDQALGASEAIRAVRRELDALRGILPRIQDLLETPNPPAIPPESTEGLRVAIGCCRDTIRILKNILRETRTSILGVLKWSYSGRDRVMNLLGDLERQKSTLNIYLSVLAM